MVDFSKKLGEKDVECFVEPISLYNSLDRASDKGPLRPAQSFVLEKWHSQRRNDKDTIIKLHTGQGKTLIGLLILQSKLNEKKDQLSTSVQIIFLLDKHANKLSSLVLDMSLLPTICLMISWKVTLY